MSGTLLKNFDELFVFALTANHFFSLELLYFPFKFCLIVCCGLCDCVPVYPPARLSICIFLCLCKKFVFRFKLHSCRLHFLHRSLYLCLCESVCIPISHFVPTIHFPQASSSKHFYFHFYSFQISIFL